MLDAKIAGARTSMIPSRANNGTALRCGTIPVIKTEIDFGHLHTATNRIQFRGFSTPFFLIVLHRSMKKRFPEEEKSRVETQDMSIKSCAPLDARMYYLSVVAAMHIALEST